MAEQRHKTIAGRFVLHGLWKRGRFYQARARDLRTGWVLQFSTRETSQRRAEDAAIERLEVEAAGPDVGQEMRFRLALEEWLDLRQVKPGTLRYYRSMGRTLATEFEGRLVSDVNGRDVERYMKNLQDRGKSARTLRHYLWMLRCFYRWARRTGYCDHDPTDELRPPRPPKRQPRALTTEEARELLVACREAVVIERRGREEKRRPPQHLFLAVLIGLHAGLRKSNVIGLRWRHVDLRKRLLHIPAGEMKANADHTVPLHPELAEVLAGLVAGRKEVDLAEPVIGDAKSFRKAWASATKRAGVAPMRFHDTRSTFASWAGQFAPYQVLQALLGHAVPDVTGKYFKASIERMREAVEQLPRLLTVDEQADGQTTAGQT